MTTQDLENALAFVVEHVTDLVFGSNGDVDAEGMRSDENERGHRIKASAAWHLGFYSRPLDGASGVVARVGGRGATFLVSYRNRQYEISLEKGEVAMANEAGARVLLNKDGKIAADAKAGQIVALNGEDYFALKDTLLAAINTFTDSVKQITANGISFTAYDAAVAAFKTALTDGTYKSSKVKLG